MTTRGSAGLLDLPATVALRSMMQGPGSQPRHVIELPGPVSSTGVLSQARRDKGRRAVVAGMVSSRERGCQLIAIVETEAA